MMFGRNVESDEILDHIKEGSIGAELGVWKGGSSKKFAAKKPAKLYLIDSWSVEPYKNSTEWSWEQYISRYSKLTGGATEDRFQKYYDDVYNGVKEYFKNYSNVEIFRGSTDKWFDLNKEELKDKLDWIYVDASHAYEKCLEDLYSSLNLVKKGGVILGDDYGWVLDEKPGVTKAVNEFVEKNKLTLKARGTSQYVIKL